MTNVSELETTPEVGDEKLSPAGAATHRTPNQAGHART